MKRKKHLKACHFEEQAKHISYRSPKAVIPIEIVELESNSYHLITPFEINGVKGEAIIDTGASVTVIDNQLLEGNENRKNRNPNTIGKRHRTNRRCESDPDTGSENRRASIQKHAIGRDRPGLC